METEADKIAAALDAGADYIKAQTLSDTLTINPHRGKATQGLAVFDALETPGIKAVKIDGEDVAVMVNPEE